MGCWEGHTTYQNPPTSVTSRSKGDCSRFQCCYHQYYIVWTCSRASSVGCQTTFDIKSISCQTVTWFNSYQTVTPLHILENSKPVSTKATPTTIINIPAQKCYRTPGQTRKKQHVTPIRLVGSTETVVKRGLIASPVSLPLLSSSTQFSCISPVAN